MNGPPEIFEGAEAVRRLSELGLSPEDLRQALRGAGEEAARYRSEDDAKNAAGLVRWARTVGLLRRRLSEKGWGRDDPQNLPMAVSRTSSVAIIATTGDGGTGFSYATPKTLYPRGKATKAAVGDEQLSIMDVPEYELTEEMARAVLAENQHRVVWFLLYHYDNHGRVLRAELSRPDPMALEVGRQVETWLERIMLETIEFEEDATP